MAACEQRNCKNCLEIAARAFDHILNGGDDSATMPSINVGQFHVCCLQNPAGQVPSILAMTGPVGFFPYGRNWQTESRQ